MWAFFLYPILRKSSILKTFCKTSVLFTGPLILLFLTSGDICFAQVLYCKLNPRFIITRSIPDHVNTRFKTKGCICNFSILCCCIVYIFRSLKCFYKMWLIFHPLTGRNTILHSRSEGVFTRNEIQAIILTDKNWVA